MPGVTVIATNQGTGVKHTAQTNAEGVDPLLALPVATYRLDVQQTGFKDFRQVNIVLNANAVLRLDITLQLGGVTDVVEVSASSVHVETSNTQLGDVIDAKTMTMQPLNGRSYIDLLGLQPGVVPVNSATRRAECRATSQRAMSPSAGSGRTQMASWSTVRPSRKGEGTAHR